MRAKSSKQRILIVDDMPINIEILREALRNDYNIFIATKGEKALTMAVSESPPDLILLDIVMSEMDGYEICEKLKEDERTQSIPVIFISGNGEVEDETKGLELGAVDYITKPFSIPILKSRVKTHLNLKKKSDLLERLACIDGLTGIPNRRKFDEFFQQEWSRARRSKSPVSLIFTDVDFFKKFNDTYGHTSGDDCLTKVAEAMEDSLNRPADFVARYGGEEFVAVLPETDMKAAVKLAEKMRANIENLNIPHSHSEISDRITLSLGVVTTIPTDGTSKEALIKAADSAIYDAKKQGRNQVKSRNGKY